MADNDDKNQNKNNKSEIKLPLSVFDELMKTLRYTNQTNEALVNMARSEEKQRRIRLFLWIIPLILVIAYSIYSNNQKNKFDPENGYVAEVQINGVIKKGADASADKLIPALQAAFKDEKAKGVVIKINSPGGSPTESILIYDEIRKLSKTYKKEIVVIGEGSIASGSYWIALAADTIYALPSTFVGSIGVIMESLDISKLAAKYDVSKHIITAGINKRRMDLFKAPDEKALVKFQTIADQLHTEFKNLVRERRGDKLSKNEDLLFSGDFWLGREAKDLGLVDVISSTSPILIDKFGTDTTFNYNQAPNFFDKMNPFAASILSMFFGININKIDTSNEYPKLMLL